MSWKDGIGQWAAPLGAAEVAHGLPTDLLARMAYQESSFIEGVIRGDTPSPAGALGILQLMPQFFTSVRVPRPFSDADVGNQIDQAAAQMASLYRSTQDWRLALAAYNAGLGNVREYQGVPPFPETENYVTEISNDVGLS